ncbi:hypothetical protein PMI05_03352 [Brevibacillus sp. BC25]|nr:hypothetical protein PMI05_03352 [Brevibacillus sp. BC25]
MKRYREQLDSFKQLFNSHMNSRLPRFPGIFPLKTTNRWYLFNAVKFQIDTNRENILCRNAQVEKVGIGMNLA